jgi:16S rRNA (cytosine1402-N4)-methyltransferase
MLPPRVGSAHEPVLLDEVMSWLQPRPGGCYCDATVGYGGHAREILARSAPDGKLIGLDRDTDALAAARGLLEPYGDRVRLYHAPFSRARQILEEAGLVPGVLLDGLLVDRPERGFSFRSGGPLDMRMDRSQGETAAELLGRLDEIEIGRIIREYGEERYASRVARAIVEARDAGGLETTADLAALVARAMPRHERHKNPATRTFQALRIVVNHEFDELEALLAVVADCLKPGGRLCVIAFHSLEDRIVKRRLRKLAGRDGGGPARFRILTKHVVIAGEGERTSNPRSRSAKLRAAERI